MKVVSPMKPMLPARMGDWTTDHLPYDAVGNWRKAFIPTFAVYIGTKHSPWEIKDRDSLEAMQDCWNHIYQTKAAAKHRISGFQDVVFVLVSFLALVKYLLMGPLGRPKVEGASKRYCQSCPPGSRRPFQL